MSDDFVRKLDEKKADIVIAHWSNFAPGRSGLYETTKELIQYENRIDGVIAGLVEPDNAMGGNADKTTVPHLVSQSHEWAFRDANLHMIHSSITGIAHRIEPNIFFIHGSPEACLWSQMEPWDRGFSFTSALQYIEKSEKVIVFGKRHKWFWERFDRKKIKLVQKGVDLERWTPVGMKMSFDGEPNILYGEVWREMKDPLITFCAMEILQEDLPMMKFHPWGLSDKRSMWEFLIGKAGFTKLLGKYLTSGAQSFPEHWYRGGDMLISPVILGEPSRVTCEALACGCPTVAWDSDAFGDVHSSKKARSFDPFNLAEKCAELWEEVKADPKGVRHQARRIAEEFYDIRIMAEQVIRVVREVLKKS